MMHHATMKRSKATTTQHVHNDEEDSRRDHGLVPRDSQLISGGGWRDKKNDASDVDLNFYKDHPLLQSMIDGDKTRRAYLENNGKIQINYTKSNDGWFKTLAVWQGRALDRIIGPWLLLTLNAIIWTVVFEIHVQEWDQESNDGWASFYSIMLNTTLSFLLVFRLNRAAERYWLARQNWGIIVGAGRHFVSGVLVHGHHKTKPRDEAIKWVAAFAIATMQFMRGQKEIHQDSLAGILDLEEVHALQEASHSPLYAACQARMALQELFCITSETSSGIAHLYAQQLHLLEGTLNVIMDNEGAMERIRGTPLPLVYVTHLRTFLIIFLASLPYIFLSSWGWATIPIVAIASFAMLGLEGASEEVESPFEHGRPNHLKMDAYCLLLFSNIQQILQHAADVEIRKGQASEYPTSNGIIEEEMELT